MCLRSCAGEQQQLIAAAQLHLLALLVGLFDILEVSTGAEQQDATAAAAAATTAADDPRQRNK